MKRLQLDSILFILFLLPIHLLAQPAPPANIDITGLWKGSLYNDTTQKHLPYEIAISDENGKLSGYSYTLFDIDGKKELGVKRIKIKRKDDRVIIEDVELILNNYSEPPPRKVRLQSVVNLLVNDTAMQLAGKWSTNQTREYRPLTGSLQLQRALDYRPLALFKKLVELKLDQELSFVKQENIRNAGIAAREKPSAEIKPPAAPSSQIADAGKPAIIALAAVDNKTVVLPANKPADEPAATMEAPPMIKTSLAITAYDAPAKLHQLRSQSNIKISTIYLPKNIVSPAPVTAINDVKNINHQPVVKKPATVFTLPVSKKPAPVAFAKVPVIKEKDPLAYNGKKTNMIEKPAISVAPVIINKKAPVISVKETVKPATSATAIVIPLPAKKEIPIVVPTPIVAAAANVSERKMSNEQSVFFESDSLVLTLYDNGEVDGDTVSVLMNGQIIFARLGLSTKANSKTIYVGKAMQDSLSLVMYAENLGSIPPNTGLMIIMDGEKRYEVRFSADLQTNAGILLRRRIKEK